MQNRNSKENTEMTESTPPLVGVVMGSKSDWETMQQTRNVLAQFGIPHECKVLSAHRTPQETVDFTRTAEERGMEVIIAAAGGAAHLAGVIAAHTVIPVLGVPMPSVVNGLDSLLSTVQMPGGVPVATVGVGKADPLGQPRRRGDSRITVYGNLSQTPLQASDSPQERVAQPRRRGHDDIPHAGAAEIGFDDLVGSDNLTPRAKVLGEVCLHLQAMYPGGCHCGHQQHGQSHRLGSLLDPANRPIKLQIQQTFTPHPFRVGLEATQKRQSRDEEGDAHDDQQRADCHHDAEVLHRPNPQRFEKPVAVPNERPVPLQLVAEEFAMFRTTTDRLNRPITLNVQEAFMTYLKVALIGGIVLTSPWIFYQVWLFVAAGLYPNEQRYVYVFLPFSLLLFFGGIAFCFFLVFPFVLTFLLGFNEWLGVTPQIRLSEWISFAVLLPLLFGVSFQLPLVMLFLDRLSIFDAATYRAKRRVAILVISIISMMLTPADPASMILMMLPLVLLYELGIWLCQYMASRNPFQPATL